MTSWKIPSAILTVLLASSLLVEGAISSPVPSDELPAPRLSPRASSTKESRRDRSIIIAVSIIVGVFLIIYLSYRCCCAPRPHGRNCPRHPHRCNANLTGHETCGQPSQVHDCKCGALEHNEWLERKREARRGDTVRATVNETELHAEDQNPGIAPPPYTPPTNGYGTQAQRAPEPAVLRPNNGDFEDGVADGRQPSSAPEAAQSKNWGRRGS